MDQQGGYIVGTATRAQKCYQLMRKTIPFLVLASFFSFVYSYFSGFPLFSYNLQFSTLIFPLFAHALDRKYMFLICNGILAFLAKNLSFTSSSLNNSGFIKSDEDGVKQITELPVILKEETVQENVAYMEYDISPPNMAVAEEEGEETEQKREQHHGDIDKVAKPMIKTEDIILESEEWEEEDDELKETKTVLERTSSVEEVNDASVSTEELNQKFEEFIRKMKEEIRIEAQQQLITV